MTSSNGTVRKMVERRSARTLRGPIPQLKSMTTYKEHMVSCSKVLKAPGIRAPYKNCKIIFGNHGCLRLFTSSGRSVECSKVGLPAQNQKKFC